MATTSNLDGNLARFAIQHALADYHLSEPDEKSSPSPKYTTSDILSPTPPQIATPRSDTGGLRRAGSVKSPSNRRDGAPARPGLLRKTSSLDSFQPVPGRLRLSEKERVQALKRDTAESRGHQKSRSVDLPRPNLGKEDVLDHYAKKSKVEELIDDVSESRDYKSLDIPRASSKDLSAEESTASFKYSSIAAEFGLGHTAQEEVNEYTVWNASITNMRVCPVQLDGGLYFYVESRSFIPKRPGITIHAGSDKAGRIVGVAHLDYFSTDNLMGVGDTASNPIGVVWYKLHRNHGTVVEFFTHVKYTFEIRDDETEQTRKFEWHRTKNLPILDDQGDLVLVEAGQTDVLAEYKGNGPLGQISKQRGSLKISRTDKFGENWQMIVLLSWASIVELSRRRARMRRSSVFRAGIF